MAQPSRITGGAFRGIHIGSPRGVRMRPTSARLREALFNILAEHIDESPVLDLYAGTGALGLEALSRGAASATFVERSSAACQAILDTAGRAHAGERVTVLRGALPAALEAVSGTFGTIFVDPPYEDEHVDETLALLAPLLQPGGKVVYEHRSKYNPAERPPGLTLLERRVYGDSAIAFYGQQERA